MKVIGIAGPARSGKDTMANSIVEILTEMKVKCKSMALAFELKRECRDFLMNTIGIDSYTENDDEKNIIRPLLVTWGTSVRRKLDEDVWVKSLEKNADPNSVIIVSDVRFENELNWVKKHGGKLIFVDRMLDNGDMVQPANEFEKENNLVLKKLADQSITWNSTKSQPIIQAIAYELLMNMFSTEELEKWTQTYPL